MLKDANWISHPKDMGFACPVLKKEFLLKKPVKSAKITMTSRGTYYAELNGKRLGDFIFAPGCTSLQRLQAQTYDISQMLKKNNVLTVILSKGWFKGRINPRSKKYFADVYEALIAKIEIFYKDGDAQTIITDQSWQSSPSKVLFADIYDGEHYDANFKHSFVPCKVQDYDKACICEQQGEKITEHERLTPTIITTPKGETVLDFKQNLTGYFEINTVAEKGELISFSFGEELDKDGNFYNENYRASKCEFKYICKKGQQIYKPLLTFWGFRYIRVDSFAGPLTPQSVTAIAVHSDIKRTGYLETSHPLLQKLFDNVIWGQKGNFLDIPTDCPQRDERMGWTGDAQIFCKTATYNFDVERFFDKWLFDLMLDQREDGMVPDIIPQYWGNTCSHAAWGDAATVCPWQIYLAYANKNILARQFLSMKAYVDYITKNTKDKYLWTGFNHYGDWLGLDAPQGSYKGSSDETFIASVFYAHSTNLVVKAGKALGKSMESYQKLYTKIVKKIQKTFPDYKTQTECTLALYFDIAKDKKATSKQLADLIISNGKRLKTGFVGTPYLLHALSQNGYTELAYDLLLQEKFPSWLYSVKCGATTMWEHWDGKNENGEFWSKDMNSFNHYAYGSVADWVYEVACGIKPVETAPGFEKIIISPQPTTKIDSLCATLDTKHGRIVSKWYNQDGKTRYEITTPSDATIIIDSKEYTVSKGTHTF